MAEARRRRLDLLLTQRGLAGDVDQARRLIASGRVLVEDRPCDKAGTLYPGDVRISVKAGRKYVSRGGDKLAAGLDGLQVDPAGWVCVDIGASTGGFTDCLLQRGAERVYAVDVGYGILDWKLRCDPRVVVLERTNARFLSKSHVPEAVDLAVIDASFISLEPILPPLKPLFRSTVRILALVKPQFQLPREMVGPGGIVFDAALHRQAVMMVEQFARNLGLSCSGIIASPVRGAKGNQEFFLLMNNAGPSVPATEQTIQQGEDNESG